MFKETFKYYKAKYPLPDYGEIIDFDTPATTETKATRIQEQNLGDDSNMSNQIQPPIGLKPVNQWKCYTLDGHPGLIVLRNPFTIQGQRYWIARCLRDYPKRPNIVNLNTRLFAQSVIDDWWHEFQHCSDKDDARRMKASMRWTTLGYHHDWDSKVYSEKMRTQFPEDLAKLAGYFAVVLGFTDFTAEAAIVNYYPIGTTLAAHTDHSEVNLEAPLFSFSFGQSAIFLIGGKTKEEHPTALFLNSGDILVMSQESRLCYHAVPRIIKAKTEVWNELLCNGATSQNITTEPCKKRLKSEFKNVPSEWSMDTALYQQVSDELFWMPFKSYLNDSRININVRQVLPAGQTSL